ncbi:protein phosphatase 1 regulatory subunit 37 [Neocloeon triangulifer]|uniref:protein phosphatase 1 regulatory subunit 37 n=1 Tax=Neocloeon triangulifer TaxID=2078957 RepID=UPI00286F7F37|nr:protein phosphatase 1 regulatory subunit 37 [Neocloeon triangulifer]
MDATEKKASRTVHFSEDESSLVTATYGPEDPWFTDEEISAEFLSAKYTESCAKHGVEPIPKVLGQLQEFNYKLSDDERIPLLDLSGTQLEYMACEALEEILKRVRFTILDLENTQISEEGAVAMFEMIEYYEACETVNISRNAKILGRGWQACSRMIKKTQCLKELIAKETCLKEEFIPFLTRSLKIGTHLSVLNLERCHLQGKPIIMLTNALRMNRSLQEIYLGENHLESTDAYNLSNLLSYNTCLQLLDLSNNIIGDKGAQHICQRLSGNIYAPSQPDSPSSPGDDKTGLKVLVMWNNCLTQSSGLHFSKLLEVNNDIEILNVGHNNLTDFWLQGLKEPLRQNTGLSRLGLQSTKLTCTSAKDLSYVFEHNRTLHRVDLRDNQFKADGLQSMYKGLEHNESMTQLDLDQNPTYLESEDLTHYQAALNSINEQLKLNSEKRPPNSYATRLPLNVGLNSRKISLTCEIKIPQTVPKKSLTCGRLRSPAPSPTPSPIMSPIPSPGKSRFSVSRVADPSPAVVPEVRSRFSITPVTDIPKIILPEDSKVTVGFQVSPHSGLSNSPGVFQFEQDTNSNRSLSEQIENEINKNINNNESVDCDDEVEQITSKIEHERDESQKREAEDSIILDVKPKEEDKFDIITEMNPAYLDSVNTDSAHLKAEKQQMSISQTFPPRITEPRKLKENAHNYSNTDNTQISKSESKSTLQSLFALFQSPSLSFTSTASAFYAKTEAKMSQIVPSLSSISLGYEPFKFSSKPEKSHSNPKMHLPGELLCSNERHLESGGLTNPLLDSTNSENQPASTSDKENTLEISSSKKKKSKKKTKEESYWDFGEDPPESVPGTSDVAT